MSTTAFRSSGPDIDHKVSTSTGETSDKEPVNYLNVSDTIQSWLLTGDHKRIAFMYLIALTIVFGLGGLAAGLVRLELTSPKGQWLSSEAYNKMFSAHGIIMVFLFLVPATPAIIGNFIIPLQLGARDLAFPRLNLVSFYLTHSFFYGRKAPQNPWDAVGLEWSHTASPPDPHNFKGIPVVTWEAYEYTKEEHGHDHNRPNALPKREKEGATV
ncbi:MAG: hypothetical protein OHK0029_04410 [Armatimonadaceae bacterium]